MFILKKKNHVLSKRKLVDITHQKKVYQWRQSEEKIRHNNKKTIVSKEKKILILQKGKSRSFKRKLVNITQEKNILIL